MLENQKGNVIVGIDALTNARAKKTGNPFQKVEKLSRFVGFVGMDYQKAVNKELQGTGERADFEAKPLQWGEWRMKEDGKPSRKIITHKGGLYVATTTSRKIRKNRKPKVQFYADGLPVDKKEIADFLPKKSPSKRQVEAGLDHPETHVERRTFSLASIKRARMNGKNYAIV